MNPKNLKIAGICLAIIGLMVILSGVLTNPRSTQAAPSAANQPSVPEKPDAQAMEIKNLKEKLEYVENTLDSLYWELETEPAFVLRQMDLALDHVERGEQKLVRGSYSDWFIPKIHDLRKAGVPKNLLQKRINRLIDLAGNGKYYSSSVKETVEREGFYVFRRYALSNLK